MLSVGLKGRYFVISRKVKTIETPAMAPSEACSDLLNAARHPAEVSFGPGAEHDESLTFKYIHSIGP